MFTSRDQIKAWALECTHDEDAAPGSAISSKPRPKRRRVNPERGASTTARRARGRGRARPGRKGGTARPVPPASVSTSEPQRAVSEEGVLSEAGTGSGQHRSFDSEGPSEAAPSAESECSRESEINLNVLRSLPSPIEAAVFRGAELPDNIKRLLQRLRRFSVGIETVPGDILQAMRQAYPDDFGGLQDVSYGPSSERAKLGGDLNARDITSIYREAEGCYFRKEHKAAWDSLVNGPILALARTLSPQRSAIGSTNITMSRLNPRYKPTTPPETGPLPGKALDFVLFLDYGYDIIEELRSLLWEPNYGYDFNHTLYAPIAKHPIAIGVLTEGCAGERSSGDAQLGIWAATHFNRLRDMLRGNEDLLPTLPLLLVQGSTWHFFLARRVRRGSQFVTKLFGPERLGRVVDPSDVFKVVSSLLLLMQWAQTEYRPWFDGVLKNLGDSA